MRARQLPTPESDCSGLLAVCLQDVMPDSRVQGTFWEAHPPAYDVLDVGQARL